MRLLPETCRVKPLRIKNAIVASCWTYFTKSQNVTLHCVTEFTGLFFGYYGSTVFDGGFWRVLICIYWVGINPQNTLLSMNLHTLLLASPLSAVTDASPLSTPMITGFSVILVPVLFLCNIHIWLLSCYSLCCIHIRLFGALSVLIH